MKGAGDFNGDVRGMFDEQTRVGPIPLTVKRPRVNTPVEFDFPVVASIDVDLGTPAPLPFPSTITAPNKFLGKPSGLPAPTSASSPSWGALNMQPRPPSPNRPHQIRPTPTFSFTDAPESGPMWTQPQTQQRRASSGPGLFAIGVLMALAGVGGYLTVKYHAWQEVAPLIARAKELGRSLRTLAPSASPESPVPAPSAQPPGAGAAAPAPQALHPTVVPIEPTAPPAAVPAARAADRTKRRSPERRPRRRLQPLSDEAAAEEALLSAPSRGR